MPVTISTVCHELTQSRAQDDDKTDAAKSAAGAFTDSLDQCPGIHAFHERDENSH